MPAFVPYLTITDYLPTIQSGQLNDQILEEFTNGKAQRQFAESWGIGKVRGLMSDRYDLRFEISPTLPYNPLKKYYGYERIILDFDAWVSETTYTSLVSVVIKDAVGYICIQSNNDEIWDEEKWQNIGIQYAIYYVNPPYPLFSLSIKESYGNYTDGFYNVGDKVWWGNYIYTAIRETSIIDREALIQLSYYPTNANNVFPNDSKLGAQYWKKEDEFFVDKGVFPQASVEGQEENYWIENDNRDPLIVQAVIDLSLYMLHKRISPMNIPKLREDAMISTMQYLRDIQNGLQTSDVLFKQPEVNNEIYWTSSPKLQNGFT